MSTRISKAYRGNEHIGWKKTVGGREWFLGYGTTPAAEAKAKSLAEVLEAKWKLLKITGHTGLSQTDFDEAKEITAGRPKWSAARAEAGMPKPQVQSSATYLSRLPDDDDVRVDGGTQHAKRWLYASIDEFVSTIKKTLKADLSNGDHVFTITSNLNRAREAIQDIPLASLRQKELEDWLLNIRTLPSKLTGKSLSPTTIRNLATAIRMALSKFESWEWWTPVPAWKDAFSGYTVKKLETPNERKRRKKRPLIYSVHERRVLWALSTAVGKACMALAEWAGHTQKEIATLALDEIIDGKDGMYIDRERHKTGVNGRWWIPPEAADYIRLVVKFTPRDPQINPSGLAFLSTTGLPLVHRAEDGEHARCDYIGHNIWAPVLRAGQAYGIRHISFKGLRKATAQLIRDKHGREVSRTFLAHADEDVQDEHYTRACLEKVEKAVRELYDVTKEMFQPIRPDEWGVVIESIRQSNAPASSSKTVAA